MPKTFGNSEDENVFLGAVCAAAAAQFRRDAHGCLARASEPPPPPPTPEALLARVEAGKRVMRRLGQEMNQLAASIEAALGPGAGGLIAVDRRKLRLAVRVFARHRDAHAAAGGRAYQLGIKAALTVTQPAGRA